MPEQYENPRRRRRTRVPKWQRFLRRYGPSLMLLVLVNKKSHVRPYILVVQCDGHEAEKRAQAFLKDKVTRMIVKNKTEQAGSVELNLEVRLKEDDTSFVNQLSRTEGVTDAVLVSYNGDYMG